MDNQAIISDINGNLCTATKRQHGLIKLSKYLENNLYNTDDESCCTFWLKTLLQIIENHTISLHAKLAHYCLYLLILNCKSNADLYKLIQTQFLEKLVTALLTPLETLTQNSLVCLHELINNFRGTLSPFKNKIEAYLLDKINNNANSYEIIKYSCKCYAKLLYLYKNINNSSNDIWYLYFQNILFNSHQIINLLFDQNFNDDSLNNDNNNSQITINRNIFSTNSLNVFIENSNFEEYFKVLSKRYESCCMILTYLMNDVDDVFAKIRTKQIFKLLKRVLSFDIRKILKNNFMNTETRSLVQVLNDIYRSTMNFTQEFFKCLKSNLILMSDDLNKLFSQYSLISKNEYLNSCLPVFYDTLCQWCDSVGTNSGFNKYLACVLDDLLENIKPFKNNIEANIKKDSKNSKNIRFQTVLIDPQSNKLALSSLKLIKSIIRTFGNELSTVEFLKIQSSIIDTLLNIQNSYKNKIPYNDENCRLSLYEVLSELCLTNNIKFMPPLTVSVNIFNQAKTDSSSHIRIFSQSSINTLRAFVNPILPIQYHEYETQTSKHSNTTGLFNLQQSSFIPQSSKNENTQSLFNGNKAQLPISNGYHEDNQENEDDSSEEEEAEVIKENNKKRRYNEDVELNGKRSKSNDSNENYEVIDCTDDSNETNEMDVENNEGEEGENEDNEDNDEENEDNDGEELDDEEIDYEDENDDDGMDQDRDDELVDESNDLVEEAVTDTSEKTESEENKNSNNIDSNFNENKEVSEANDVEEKPKERLVAYDESDEAIKDVKSQKEPETTATLNENTNIANEIAQNGHEEMEGKLNYSDAKENIEASLPDGKKDKDFDSVDSSVFQTTDKTLKEMMNSLNVETNPN